MHCPGTNDKSDHRHTGNRPARDPMEGGGGVDRHSSTSKPQYARHSTRVQGWKRYGDGYNGVEALSRARHHRPVTPLPGIPVPKEGL